MEKYYKGSSKYFLQCSVTGLGYLEVYDFDLLIIQHSTHFNEVLNFIKSNVFMFLQERLLDKRYLKQWAIIQPYVIYCVIYLCAVPSESRNISSVISCTHNTSTLVCFPSSQKFSLIPVVVHHCKFLGFLLFLQLLAFIQVFWYLICALALLLT